MAPINPPGVHPDPPGHLAASRLPIVELRPATLFRVHQSRYGALYFNRDADQRFNAPDGSYGVLYAGETERCAFIETAGQDVGPRIVSRRWLAARAMATLELKAPLRLVDLNGRHLARMGAEAGLLTGPHPIARKWSAALSGHKDRPDGLRYRARHDNDEFAYALFDRCKGKIAQRSSVLLLDSTYASRLATILEEYDFTLL
jgi:hypothetical protein